MEFIMKETRNHQSDKDFQWTQGIFKTSLNCLPVALSRQGIYDISTRQLNCNQLQTCSEMSR